MKKEFDINKLKILCYDTRNEMGEAGAKHAAALIRNVYKKNGQANLIFASSPSQLEMLTALLDEDVDWKKINAFHMDEYAGLGIEHKSSFANYIRENFLGKLKTKNTFYLNGLAADLNRECDRYSELLKNYPVDITFAGIGENGHLAFNDPDIADFFEPRLMKINETLDKICRQQQVNDGWFEKLGDVPDKALTITFPGLLHAGCVFTTVPGLSKSEIVARTLEGPICHEVPASILRLHNNSILYIDKDSASKLGKFRSN